MHPIYEALQEQFFAKARLDLEVDEDFAFQQTTRRSRMELYDKLKQRRVSLKEDSNGFEGISLKTFERYFLGEKVFSDATQIATLDDFAIYIGFESFDEFKSKHQKKSGDKMPEQKSGANLLIWVSLVAALAIIMAVIYRSSNNSTSLDRINVRTNYDTISHAKATSLIYTFNETQFNLFGQIPNLTDTQLVLKHAWQDGFAYREVRKIAHSHVDSNSILDKSRSNYSIIEVRLIDQSDTSARIETDEHWTLNWILPNGDLRNYDVTNKQLYSIRRRANEWKVYANAYAGHSKRISRTAD